MNGGYVMANFKGFDIAALPITYPGVYSGIETAMRTGKMILVGGMQDSSHAISTVPVTVAGPYVGSGEGDLHYYIVTLPQGVIVVREDDYVALFD